MKRRRVTTYTIGDKELLSLYGYGFTVEEAMAIKDALCKYDIKRVIAFIIDAEAICTQHVYLKPIEGVALTQVDRSAEKKKILKHFQTTLKDLENLLDNKVKLIRPENIEDKVFENLEDVAVYDLYRQRLLRAEQALRDVSDFVRISNQPLAKGRPPVDSTHLVKELMIAYEKYIDKATTYRDGPFFETTRIILKAVKLPSEDPSRAIQNSLR